MLMLYHINIHIMGMDMDMNMAINLDTEEVNIHLFIQLSSIYYFSDGWGYQRYSHIKCFSADSYVKLSSGEHKMINYVKSGDQLITIDRSKVISTDMIMMLDKQISTKGIYIHDSTKVT